MAGAVGVDTELALTASFTKTLTASGKDVLLGVGPDPDADTTSAVTAVVAPVDADDAKVGSETSSAPDAHPGGMLEPSGHVKVPLLMPAHTSDWSITLPLS